MGGETASCGTDGFPATEGWDPSTGFGTPVSFSLLFLMFGFKRALLTILRLDLPGVGQACAREVSVWGRDVLSVVSDI